MAEIDTDWIARRAYALWEEEGRPDGRHDIHWQEARQAWETSQAGASATSENAEPRTRVARRAAPPQIPPADGGGAATPRSPRGRRKE